MARESGTGQTRDAGLGVLLVVAVAAGGLAVFQRGGPAANGAAKPAAAAVQPSPVKEAPAPAPTESPACGLGAPCLLASYLGRRPEDAQAVWDKTCANLRHLVFLVPDPIDAHVGWQFDADLEAIQRAAEVSHYTLDRFVLPWDAGAVKRAACGAVNGGPTKACGTREAHQTQPGVLLFRSSKSGPPPPAAAGTDENEVAESSEPLVVYLVGETPTGGIQKAAFTAALTEIAKCRTDQIRIVGPTFSGSTRSLALALKGWWQANGDWQIKQRDWRRASGSRPARGTPIRIVSGTATSVPVEELRRVGLTPDRVEAVSFKATVLPDADVFAAFVNGYLQQELGVPPERIALLVEANTSYGQSLGKEGAPDRGRTDVENRSKKAILTLPFPMHIAGARSALEKARTRAPSNGESLPVARPEVEVTLDDDREPLDLPPQMFPRLTGPSVEFVLANILATISRNQIQYVGLLASDTRDKIFLAGQIKKYCPDVRLFTFESDLLYAHPEFRDVLSGMLVASTYPLFNRTQAWTGPSFRETVSRRLQFSNSAAQGIYNAALLQLGYGAEFYLTDYAMPRTWHDGEPAKQAANCSDQCGEGWAYCWCQEPVLWISAVGNGGLWPLEARRVVGKSADRDGSGDPYVWARARPLAGDDLPKPTMVEPGSAQSAAVFWFVLTAFSLVQVARYLASNFSSAHAGNDAGLWDRALAWLGSDLFTPRLDHRGEQAFYVLVCFGTLTGLYAFVSIYFVVEPASTYGTAPWVIPVCLGALSLVLVDAVAAAAVRRTDKAARYLRLSPSLGLAVVLVALTLGAPYWDSVLAVPQEWKVWGMLAYERATNLESQISPLVPSALVAGVWFLWGRCHLRRLWLLEDRAVQCVLGGRPNESGETQGVRERAWTAVAQQIRTMLERPFTRPLALAGWFWVLPCVGVGASFLPTFEPPSFDICFEAAFLLASVMVVIAFAQALSLWWQVRWLLERLAAHPAAAAYEHLSTALKRRVRDAWYAFTPALGDFERAVVCARRLADGLRGNDVPLAQALAIKIEDGERLREALEGDIATAESVLKAVVASGRNGMTAARGRDLQAIVDSMAALLAERLRSVWDRTPARETPKPDASPVAAWLTDANELVALQSLTYVGLLFVHIRNLLSFATAGLLLLLLAVPSYPFEPQRLLGLLVWALVLTMVGGVVMAVVQMNRSEVLSWLTGGTPNEVSFDRTLFAPILKFGALPIASLLATQLPGIGESLFSWLEPALRAIK